LHLIILTFLQLEQRITDEEAGIKEAANVVPEEQGRAILEGLSDGKGVINSCDGASKSAGDLQIPKPAKIAKNSLSAS